MQACGSFRLVVTFRSREYLQLADQVEKSLQDINPTKCHTLESFVLREPIKLKVRRFRLYAEFLGQADCIGKQICKGKG